MSRRRNASEFIRDARQKRAHALSRIELREPTAARVAPSSPISAQIKAVDPEVERLKAEYEAKIDKIDSDIARKCLQEFESKKEQSLATRKP